VPEGGRVFDPELKDARARKLHRRASAARSRKVDIPGAPATLRRRRKMEAALETEAPDLPDEPIFLLDVPVEHVSALMRARDANTRQLLHSAAIALLYLYRAHAAREARPDGRRCVAGTTRRQFAHMMGRGERYIYTLDQELRAAGLVDDGGRYDAGDGQRGYVKKCNGRSLYRTITRKRAVRWLHPRRSLLPSTRTASRPSDFYKAGNLLPADLLSDQQQVLDPLSASAGATATASQTTSG